MTTRAHVHYVVTEYGVASLFGKSLSERARELITIAHPEDRCSSYHLTSCVHRFARPAYANERRKCSITNVPFTPLVLVLQCYTQYIGIY